MNEYNKFTCSTMDPGLRRDFIGASDAPIIMGDSPWCTPLELYERKLGLCDEPYISTAMQRGIDLEAEARQELSKLIKRDLAPFRMFSARSPWMMANFDAMDVLRLVSAEIKCPMNPDFSEEVPKHYYAQIQHQLYVSRHKEMIYFCYHPLGSKLIWVQEDLEYQKILVEKTKEFHDRIKNLNPPPVSDRDFISRQDEVWHALTEEYKYLYSAAEEINAQLKESRYSLIYACDNKSSQGNGVKVSRSVRTGSIDYTKAYEEYTSLFQITDFDLEKYRKKESGSWRITL